MAAVEGGQTAMVQYIMNLQFHKSSQDHVEKGKNCKDKQGNTALHLAYKNMNGEIHKLLGNEHIGGSYQNRNLRALAPVQMNHKRVLDA